MLECEAMGPSSFFFFSPYSVFFFLSLFFWGGLTFSTMTESLTDHKIIKGVALFGVGVRGHGHRVLGDCIVLCVSFLLMDAVTRQSERRSEVIRCGSFSSALQNGSYFFFFNTRLSFDTTC